MQISEFAAGGEQSVLRESVKEIGSGSVRAIIDRRAEEAAEKPRELVSRGLKPARTNEKKGLVRHG